MVCHGILLHRRGLQFRLVAPDGLIGYRDDAHHVIAAADEAVEGLDGEVGGAHIDYTERSFHRGKG